MANRETERQYWGIDHVRRVPYRLHWIDNRFGSFLDKVYGDRKKLLDRIAAQISISETGETAKSHPTGGRALVYELKTPFPDADFNLKCPEIDVKGVLLTSSGHRTYSHDLAQPKPRREIHKHKTRDDIFGPLSLEEADADKDNVRFARGQGFFTHLPVAILIPEKIVFNGQLTDPAEIIDLLNLPPDSQFALYVRAFPITSTRSSDFFTWPEKPCDLPHIWLPDSVFAPHPVIKAQDFIKKVKFGRCVWQEIERPKLIRAFEIKDSRQFDEHYYSYVYQMVVNQIVQIFATGISPCSGQESDNQSLSHTHLQNKTALAAEVEWAPYTAIDRLDSSSRSKHLIYLLNKYYEYLVNTAFYCLDDWERIPSFPQLLTDVSEIIGSHPEFDQIKADFSHDQEIDDVTEVDDESLVKIVKILRRRAGAEKILENAKKLAPKII